MDAGVQEGETKKWDMVGIGLSVLCAIHCLSVPFLVGLLPVLGLDFVADHEFEWVMMTVIFLVAGVTYYMGYKQHRRAGVWAFFATGVLVFAVVRPLLPHELHPAATISGGIVFVLGHWKNWHWHRPTCRKPCCSGK